MIRQKNQCGAGQAPTFFFCASLSTLRCTRKSGVRLSAYVRCPVRSTDYSRDFLSRMIAPHSYMSSRSTDLLVGTKRGVKHDLSWKLPWLVPPSPNAKVGAEIPHTLAAAPWLQRHWGNCRTSASTCMQFASRDCNRVFFLAGPRPKHTRTHTQASSTPT